MLEPIFSNIFGNRLALKMTLCVPFVGRGCAWVFLLDPRGCTKFCYMSAPYGHVWNRGVVTPWWHFRIPFGRQNAFVCPFGFSFWLPEAAQSTVTWVLLAGMFVTVMLWPICHPSMTYLGFPWRSKCSMCPFCGSGASLSLPFGSQQYTTPPTITPHALVLLTPRETLVRP